MGASALAISTDRRLGAAMRDSRVSSGMSLRDLAVRAHTSASRLCEIENGSDAPLDILAGVIRATGDWSLAAEACHRCPVPRILKTPRLSPERVDLHIMTVHTKTGQELQEAMAAHERLTPHLINKRQPADLSPADQTAIDKFYDEGLQAVVALEHEFIALAKLSGRDPEQVLNRLYSDLRQKGYLD